mgnify:CR=1 FL=1
MENKFFKNITCFSVSLITLAVFLPVAETKAVTVENLPNAPVVNDYVVGPGKVELLVSPGEVLVKNIIVTNRFGRNRDFKIELEDFKGSREGNNFLELLGPLKGPYSLKDYLVPEVMNFTLKHGDRMAIPVRINIPADAVPGGLYGSVIVSTSDDDKQENAQNVSGNVQTKSRIAVLFFIRIRGDVKEEGNLQEFKTDKKFYNQGPVNFSLAFENTGSVYSNPSGNIEIKNIYGTTVDNVKVEQFYVLPDSIRTSQIKWDLKGLMLGYYRAHLKLDHGYDNVITERTIGFWVIPVKLVLIVLLILLIVLALIVFIIRWIRDNVEIKKKDRPAVKIEEDQDEIKIEKKTKK